MRNQEIKTQRELHGRKAVAVLPIHYPKELLTALDVLAVELWGPPGPPRGDDAGRVQSYVCSVVRNALAFLAGGHAEAVDGVLFPHTCDSIQQLATLATDLGGWKKPAFTFLHPRGADRPSARRFVEAELRRLAGTLERFTGRTLTEERLASALALHAEVDAARAALLEGRARLPLDDTALYALLRRGEWRWPGDHLAELRSALATLAPEPVQRGVPVLVTGYLPEPAALLSTLNGAGAYLAADDYAAVGRRVIRTPPAPDGDPWRWLTDRYFAAPPCPTRAADTATRMAHLGGLAERSGARGVLVHVMKFCEPELFDVPAIRETFAARGLPVLVLEGELEGALSGQAVTRLEAFAELLQGARGGGLMLRRAQYELAGQVAFPILTALEAWQHRLKRARRKPGGGPFGPPLESVRKLKELMGHHYFQGRYADGAVPVAWVTSGFPVEVLRAAGFHTVYPENHAALCGVQRLTPAYSDVAEGRGYSRDLCSYVRTDLGSVLSSKTPVGRLPRPQLLACSTNICQTVLYWYRELSRHLQVPLVLVDTPFVHGAASAHQLAYVREQLEELAEVAGRVAGRPLDAGRLAEVTRLAKEGSTLWGECLAASRARPAPWTGIDGFFHIAPIVTLRGTEACNGYYRFLRDELNDRVARGVGGLKEERHRLLWDNLPVWFAVRRFSTLLAERGFNFVSTSYTNAWAEAGVRVDPADPLGSAAWAYTHIILNQDLPNRLDILRRLSRDYAVDGAILHSDRSCKPYSIGQVDLRERLAAELGIRVLLLEADHNDPRSWAAEPGENRLAAFMEGFE